MSNIAQTFGVLQDEPVIENENRITTPVPVNSEEFSKQLVENKKKDYHTARDNLLNLLQDVQKVVRSTAVDVVVSPTDKMVQAFANLSKIYAEINKDLISISNNAPENKTQQKTNDDNHPVNNNVIFVGTSDSLIDHIKGNFNNG